MMKPLAWVLLGGLTVSTMLTLVFIPVFFSVVEERRDRRRQKKQAKWAALESGASQEG